MNGMGGMTGGSRGSSAGDMNGMMGAAPSPGVPPAENDAPKTRVMGNNSDRKGCCAKRMDGTMRGSSGGMGNMDGMMGGSTSAPHSPAQGNASR